VVVVVVVDQQMLVNKDVTKTHLEHAYEPKMKMGICNIYLQYFTHPGGVGVKCAIRVRPGGCGFDSVVYKILQERTKMSQGSLLSTWPDSDVTWPKIHPHLHG
jgi:hypothetical protein